MKLFSIIQHATEMEELSLPPEHADLPKYIYRTMSTAIDLHRMQQDQLSLVFNHYCDLFPMTGSHLMGSTHATQHEILYRRPSPGLMSLSSDGGVQCLFITCWLGED